MLSGPTVAEAPRLQCGFRRKCEVSDAGTVLNAWVLGFVGTEHDGAFVHVLLVISVVLLLVGLISGCRIVV
jgi:uncharacterized membrane protein YtjA (UPF0391 family)